MRGGALSGAAPHGDYGNRAAQIHANGRAPAAVAPAARLNCRLVSAS
jgi:hypothetical protein